MTDLIVSAAAPMVQYIADGSGRSYGFPFPLLAAEDLAVWLDDAPSPIAFTVSGLNSSGGGGILFATPPEAGLRITLARRMAIKRETDFVEGGEFRARALNEELDRLTLLLQQVDALAGLALRAAIADAPASLTLPPAAERAGKLLGFDAEGNAGAMQLHDEGAGIAAMSAASHAAEAAAAAAAAMQAQQQVLHFTNQPQAFLFDADGVQTDFLLPVAPAGETALWVFVGGIFQRPPSWSLENRWLRFATPPPAGARRVAGLIGSAGIAQDSESRFQHLAWEMARLTSLAAQMLPQSRIGLGPSQLAPAWATFKS